MNRNRNVLMILLLSAMTLGCADKNDGPKDCSVEGVDTGHYTLNSNKDGVNPHRVMIIRYIPTSDGINVDMSEVPDFGSLNPISVENLEQKLKRDKEMALFMFEEATKFRGYKSTDAVPYLDYMVVEEITMYKNIPVGDFWISEEGGVNRYQPDYHKIFEETNAAQIINEKHVKEVWLWHGQPATPNWGSYSDELHGSIEKHVGFVETNMSSEVTGDISNSYRYDEDLPLLDHSYIVYGFNLRRDHSSMIHNHGHQLEFMYDYISELHHDNTFFRDEFEGLTEGRCGNVHIPPNTTEDYDYCNSQISLSDIEDWAPDNSGTKTCIGCDSWTSIPRAWPYPNNSAEADWLVYWMQNLPGYQNGIDYEGDKKMTNWWQFVHDWDKNAPQVGLHE